jgi:hypothetical protein
VALLLTPRSSSISRIFTVKVFLFGGESEKRFWEKNGNKLEEIFGVHASPELKKTILEGQYYSTFEIKSKTSIKRLKWQYQSR